MADDVSLFFLLFVNFWETKHIDLNLMKIFTGWNRSDVEWQHGNTEQKAQRSQSLANSFKWQNCYKGGEAKLPSQS